MGEKNPTPQVDPALYEDAPIVPLSDKERLHRIVWMRIETRPGKDVWSIRQVWGTADGQPCRVELPVTELPREGMTAALIEMFKGQGRWIKGMDVFEPGVLSKRW